MQNILKGVFFLLLVTIPIHAQRTSERMVILNPLFNNSNSSAQEKISWINSIGGWGEFGNYFNDEGKTHEWYQKLGLFMEFFRFGDKKSLSVISNIEFIADPQNDINFNPRGIFWEEAFLYTERTGGNFWQAGYYHRCKHDIDNLDYGNERSLIYGSIMGKYILSLLREDNLKGVASLQGELYTILQDYRKPENLIKPDTEDLVSSAGLNIKLINYINNTVSLSAGAYLRMNLYSTSRGMFRRIVDLDYMEPSGGMETGISINGNARFSLILRYEYLSDTGLNVVPVSANLFSIGVSLYPVEIF